MTPDEKIIEWQAAAKLLRLMEQAHEQNNRLLDEQRKLKAELEVARAEPVVEQGE